MSHLYEIRAVHPTFPEGLVLHRAMFAKNAIRTLDLRFAFWTKYGYTDLQIFWKDDLDAWRELPDAHIRYVRTFSDREHFNAR